MNESSRIPELAAQCTDLMRRLADLTRVPDSEWLALDIGMGQLKALIVLKEQGRQTVGGLARALTITEPSASLLLDKLVTRGLVERETDREDRRRTFVGLSEAGQDLMTRLRRTKDERFTGWFSRLSQEDLEGLERGLAALYSVVATEVEGAAFPVGAAVSGAGAQRAPEGRLASGAGSPLTGTSSAPGEHRS